jgi:hypothetical protein
MTKQLCRWVSILFLLLAAAVPPADAAAKVHDGAEAGPFYNARYEIHFMDTHVAEALAWDQVPETLKDRSRVSVVAISGDSSRRGYLDVMTDSLTHERISRALVKADSTPRTQVFQVILLAASHQPGASAQDLPASAQKALADVRDFLPFKSYEILDSTWLRTTREVMGRVVGRQGAGYRIELTFQPVGDPADKQLLVTMLRVREESPLPPAAPPSMERGKTASTPAPRAPRDIIATSFGLKSGETIVVGTSKADDGDALVVLLTAVP